MGGHVQEYEFVELQRRAGDSAISSGLDDGSITMNYITCPSNFRTTVIDHTKRSLQGVSNANCHNNQASRMGRFGALRKHPKTLAQELRVQWINAQRDRGNSSERELHESVNSFICHLSLEHVFVSDRVTNVDDSKTPSPKCKICC
jgi:hypothetical protein